MYTWAVDKQVRVEEVQRAGQRRRRAGRWGSHPGDGKLIVRRARFGPNGLDVGGDPLGIAARVCCPLLGGRWRGEHLVH